VAIEPGSVLETDAACDFSLREAPFHTDVTGGSRLARCRLVLSTSLTDKAGRTEGAIRETGQTRLAAAVPVDNGSRFATSDM
jgi:hypothetical protein